MRLAIALIIFQFSIFHFQSLKAQYIKLDRHCSQSMLDDVFFDAVQNNVGSVFKSAYGQFFGQITKQGEIYGFGTFYTDQNGEIFGSYRNGSLIFGIKMGTTTASVGSDDHYIVYDLRTAEALYIMKDNLKYAIDADNKAKWSFVQITYNNGDKYVGEALDNKPDGFGIYYYSNGNFYYGQYKGGKTSGYGALFKTDNRVVLFRY